MISLYWEDLKIEKEKKKKNAVDIRSPYDYILAS